MTIDLFRLARGRDTRAFEALVEGAMDGMYATATLILHDRTLAEDAVQETLVRAWRSLSGLRDAGRFDAWLHRVLVHACIDTARAARDRRTEQELPLTLTDGAGLEGDVLERDAGLAPSSPSASTTEPPSCCGTTTATRPARLPPSSMSR